jgi:hypothetical protein
MDEPDPKSNLIEFTRQKRDGTIQAVRAPYGACEHLRVTVDQATKSVACRECKTPLDAFTVLWELAIKQRRWLDQLDEWDAYRDSLLSQRYDLEWQRRQDDVTAPPDDPAIRKVWDTFHAYIGDSFCAMYRRNAKKRTGVLWYGRTSNGGCVSYDYARSQLVPKIEVVP